MPVSYSTKRHHWRGPFTTHTRDEHGMCQLRPAEGLPKRRGQESPRTTKNDMEKQMGQGKQALLWSRQALPCLTVVGTLWV